MIKNIILPEQIGNYFLFSEDIIGIDIGKTHIHATQVRAKGASITIERCWSEPIDSNKKSYEERVVATLKNVFTKIDKSTLVYTAISSSHVVFKRLRLPFTSRDKIKMVIKFEVEPLLPFSIQDAEVDFIILNQDSQNESAEVLIAAVQKQHLAQQIALFESAGIDPELVTVDMFALYGLYTQIPVYNDTLKNAILIDLGLQSTRLTSIQNGELFMIRSMPQGLTSLAKEIASATESTQQQVLENIIRFGLSHSEPQFQKALKDALTAFWQRIQFALNALTTSEHEIKKILLLGSGADINGITRFVTDLLSIGCDYFDVGLIKENTRYHLKNAQNIPHSAILSIAIALPTPTTQDFNLRANSFAPQNEKLFIKQLVWAGACIVAIGILLTSHLISQSRVLKKELRLSEQETIEMLKTRFPSIPEDEDDLETIKDSATTELKNEEDMWYAFTRQSRVSFLEYLLELSTRINKSELGFVPDQLTITDGQEGQIVLKAHVRDFEALKKLEQSLRESKLFSYVEGQTSPDFTMKILVGKPEGS